MPEFSPSSPSSPAELSSTDDSVWSNEWTSLENYEDPRLDEPPVVVGYNPRRVVTMSQGEIDSISDDLLAEDDADQSQTWLRELLLGKGFSEKDLERGVTAMEVDGELVAVVTDASDFGTRRINVEFAPMEGAGEEGSIEPGQETLGEQAEIFNKLVNRLKGDLADSGLELSLNDGATSRQETQREVSDAIGIIRALSRGLMDGQTVNDQTLVQFSERMNHLRIAISNDADATRIDAGHVVGLTSDIEDASSSAQKNLDDEAPEREEFYHLTIKLTELSEDLRSSMLRNINASEEVAASLLQILNTVEEIRYSQYGHETFSRMLSEYAIRLETEVQNSSLSRRQIEGHFKKIKELLG